MGYGLMIYAVDTVHLGDLIGCRDYKRLVEIEAIHWVNDEIERLDEEFDTYSYDEEEHIIPVVHTALTDIIMGKIPERGYYSSLSAPTVYAYAYLILCKLCSHEFLSNAHWYPVPLDFMNQVDEIYRSAGLEFSNVVTPLVEDGPLMMKISGWPDFPLLGHVPPESVHETYAAMKQIDIETFVKGQDEWTQAAVREARGWYAKVVQMNEQVKRDGINAEFALVGAYH